MYEEAYVGEPLNVMEIVQHYEFGKNWQRFLTVLNDDRISAAERSLKVMLGVQNLVDKRFLDIGSGSGLFSLAARRLGAHVVSFDRDPDSVECTRELKRRHFPTDNGWVIEEGSILDAGYVHGLGKFEVVYAWGVLHHTGSLWQALENALIPLPVGGKLFLAIYNDQGRISAYWKRIKYIYTRRASMRFFILCTHGLYLAWTRLLPRLLNGRLRSERGMALWFDLKDWLGGYPFEVATPKAVIDFCGRKGCTLYSFRPCGDPSGNNEFVFVRREELPSSSDSSARRAER